MLPARARDMLCRAGGRSLAARSLGSWHEAIGRAATRRLHVKRDNVYDVAIVGGGIMGLNTAYQISRRAPDMRVVVLEGGTGLGEGSSGYSSAIIRCMYSHDPMMQFAVDGKHIYENWAEYIGDDNVTARFHQHGQVWIFGKTREQVLKDQARFSAFGVRTSILTPQEMAARWPINPCTTPLDNTGEVDHDCLPNGEDEAILLEEDGGYFEPNQALADLRMACERNGVEVRMKARAARVAVDGGRAVGVEMADGSGVVHAGRVLNSAGPWGMALHDASTSVPLPVELRPIRIQVVYKKAPNLVHSGRTEIPNICDLPGGVYMRPQVASGQVLVSTVKEEEEREVVDPSDFNRSADPEQRQKLLASLHHRLPTLEPRGEVSSFSALYTVNHADVHPLIGPFPALDNYFIALGFSGHGFKIAPVVGGLLAKQITGGLAAPMDSTIDPIFFDPMRQPIPMQTKNVLA